MPINPNIQATVDLLDERISNLQKIKQMLLSEYGIAENGAKLSTAVRAPRKPPRKAPNAGRSPRRRQLIDFLCTDGPTRRGEIVQKTGMPMGSVSYLLNDKKTFRRLDSGKWDVRKELKAGIPSGE